MTMSILGLALVVSGCTLYHDKETRLISVFIWCVGLLVLAGQALV